MVVSTAQWARSTTQRPNRTPRCRRIVRRPTSITGGAEWVPGRARPTLTVARFVGLFEDDRKLIGLKLMMLAAIVIAVAVLDWAV